MELERMMAPFGPTGGKLVRPSDGNEAKDIAFIQCAGSRDKNHLAQLLANLLHGQSKTNHLST